MVVLRMKFLRMFGSMPKLETHTMESLIYRLRKKIEDDPNQPRTLIQINKKYYLNLG